MKRLCAALIFFTRFPWGKIAQVSVDDFKHVVPYWPLVGWLTGGILAGTLWLAAQFLPIQVAWLVAIVVRLLCTGCLHEDGLSDFFDGFGGGGTRERILSIMKDSRVGTYGVVGLIGYFLLFTQMHLIPFSTLCVVAFCADAYTKAVVAQIINLLPYARTEAGSKAHVVYTRMSMQEVVVSVLAGVFPLVCWGSSDLWSVCWVPLVGFLLLCGWMHRKIGGYTGDCCGAAFLLCELMFYIAVLVGLWN